MPLDEIALEELGLAPRWVRKGMPAGQAGAQDAGTNGERAADAAHEAVASTAPMARSSAESVTAASANLSAQAAAEPTHRTVPSQPAAQGVTAPVPELYAFAQEPAAQTPPGRVVVEAAQGTRAAQPASEEPPPLTEDDFAWFDAVPEPSLPHDLAPAPAPRNDVATLDWDALAERVASCTRCRLCEKRTNTVFGVGDRAAEWMLIGEAPGENEDRLGEPFVGQAGKLLDNMLRALSLARGENVYIANVIKCRPPGNRNPEPDEVARCEPYLQRQVALVKPKIIVALGRFAAQSLLKTDGSIASLRGRVHQYEGVPVIVSYHPAYLLRSLHDKSKAWADLCLARDTLRAAGGGER
ncbi:uracil-DNA glycosylase family protein [Paraburkholderia tagetis]|uniref:Type-4 uracil-DNA glycosylase n=1 Tax=Paraburkholderia tagetis TaxID=2913261 RepID=A0A9X1UEE5_9BURK|nr:uracil-DNA glycosylase family protein [Paraburkholderia tagetis]MCG5073539.1 uracil-DNA glycosylase [Paraburkholderia tagetis]